MDEPPASAPASTPIATGLTASHDTSPLLSSQPSLSFFSSPTPSHSSSSTSSPTLSISLSPSKTPLPNSNSPNPPLTALASTSAFRQTSSSSSPNPLPPQTSNSVASLPVPSSSVTPAQSTTSSTSKRHHSPRLPSASVLPSPPTSPYWSLTPHSGRLPRGLRAHSSTLYKDSIYSFGGCDIKGQVYKDLYRLETGSWVWSKLKTVGTGPSGGVRAHTANLVPGGRLVVFGGGDGPGYFNDTWLFDLITLTWSKPKVEGVGGVTEGKGIPSKRRAHASIVWKGLLIVFGGGNGSNALNDLWSLDLNDEECFIWRELVTTGYSGSSGGGGDKKPIARGYHSMTLVPGDCAVVFGGSDGTECFGDVWLLDLNKLEWREVTPSPSPSLSEPGTTMTYNRLSHSATCVGSYIFVVGGHDGVNFSNEVLLFNLVTLSFEPKVLSGRPPSPRGYHQSLLHDSRILLLGGFDGQKVFDHECWTLDLAGSSFLPQITNFRVGVEDGDEEEVAVGKEGS